VRLVQAGVYGYGYPTYEISIGSAPLANFGSSLLSPVTSKLTSISNSVPNTGARLPYLTRLSKRNEYAAFWLNQDNSTLFYNYLDPQSLQRQIPNDQIVETINTQNYKILSNSTSSSLLLGWFNGSDFNLKRLDLFKNPTPELISMNVTKVGNAYRAYAGDLVKITGKNFGKTTLTNTVKFGSIQASVIQGLTTGNEITVVVPPGLTREPVPVTVAFDDQVGQSTFLFENLTLPIVTSIDTTIGEVGDVVTVTGAKFATDPTQMAVRFGVIAVAQDEIISVTSTQIKVKVPKLAQRGSGQAVSVIIQDQVVPAPQLFRVIIPPVVESVETETDFISCKQVIIRGKNFGNVANALQVKFGDIVVPSSDLIATDVAIIVNVPLGAEGAVNISIKVDDREALSEIINAKLGSYIEPGSNHYPHNFNLTARKDDKVELRIKILNECSVQEVKFWKKGISEPDLNWKNEVLTTLDANRIDHVILENSMTDPIGLEAYYEILDKSSKSVRSDTFRIYKQFSELDSTNFVPGLAFGGDIVDYNIISIPYQLTSNGLTSVFKDIFNVYGYDSTKWRVYHYNNDGLQTPKYVEYLRGLTEINPGKGYWIIIRNKQDIFIDKGTTVDLDNGPFEITLQPGWNQIGNPYDFEIMWSDVLSYNGNPAGIESLKTYKSGAFVVANSLPRFTGGFIRYNGSTPLALKIPYTNKKSTGGRTQSGSSYTAELTSDQWRVNLNLLGGGMVNQLASVGIHPDALIETDPFDEHAMPLIGGFANISFDGNLAASILPTASSLSWSFVVNSLMNTESMTLSWDNAHFGNNDLQIYLYDKEEERLINMRTNSTHTFKNRSKYPFEIHFGSQQYIDDSTSPERMVLGNVYPNPMTELTRIPFTVTTDQASTQLMVYSLQGQQLRTLINSELKAGFYEAEWDGRDASGNKISNGLVLVRLQTTVGNRIQSTSKKIIINR
jgi:IPT/TIG domain